MSYYDKNLISKESLAEYLPSPWSNCPKSRYIRAFKSCYDIIIVTSFSAGGVENSIQIQCPFHSQNAEKPDKIRLFKQIVAERAGFEPACRFRQTDFECVFVSFHGRHVGAFGCPLRAVKMDQRCGFCGCYACAKRLRGGLDVSGSSKIAIETNRY